MGLRRAIRLRWVSITSREETHREEKVSVNNFDFLSERVPDGIHIDLKFHRYNLIYFRVPFVRYFPLSSLTTVCEQDSVSNGGMMVHASELWDVRTSTSDLADTIDVSTQHSLNIIKGQLRVFNLGYEPFQNITAQDQVIGLAWHNQNRDYNFKTMHCQREIVQSCG
uniref:Uncharacterized protein n=1 Tax=Knipowitschia caucasica TaxID=637954 RepID=A0AAV2JCU2_KNICA